MYPLMLVQIGYGVLFSMCVWLRQKSKLSTMVSSNVQSIFLPMDCMA